MKSVQSVNMYTPRNPRLLRRRYFYDFLLRFIGFSAIALPLFVLFSLFFSTFRSATAAFFYTSVQVPIHWDVKILNAGTDTSSLDLSPLLYDSLHRLAPAMDDFMIMDFFSQSAVQSLHVFLRSANLEALAGTTSYLWIPTSAAVDMAVANNEFMLDLPMPTQNFIAQLQQDSALRSSFDFGFFVRSDSRFPEEAGIGAALLGTFYIMLLTIIFSFFMGVAAAIYLEEFSKRTLFTTFVEVNINNLGAVPSIVFGLLGLSVFISIFHIPRSTPFLAAMVLSLMTLPTIIITSRLALRSVSLTIRESAFSLGASKIQVVFHHVVPSAFPSILTGVILAIARAIGETAPLLMIGMVAFIPTLPDGFFSPSVSMPVQIYLWSAIPEPAYVAKASAAILVLLAVLLLMNALAIFLRIRFERKT